MASIRVRVKLDKLTVANATEAPPEQPYVVPVYVMFDGKLVAAALDSKLPHVELSIPMTTAGPGDLAGDGDMAVHDVAQVREAVGSHDYVFETSADITPAISSCAALVAVIFLEHDSTLARHLRAALHPIRDFVQRQLDAIARVVITARATQIPGFVGFGNRESGHQRMDDAIVLAKPPELADPNTRLRDLDVDKIVDLFDPVKDIAEASITQSMAKDALVTFGTGFDPDDYIGADGAPFELRDLIGTAHAPTTFTLDTGDRSNFVQVGGGGGFGHTMPRRGRYTLTGTIRRTEVDEPPVIAVSWGTNSHVAMVVRRLDDGSHDTFWIYRSTDGGTSFARPTKVVGNDAQVFISGPGAAASRDGTAVAVVGIGKDATFRLALSANAGATFSEWTRVDGTGFRGSPAVCFAPDGTLHFVARGLDRRYHYCDRDVVGRFSAWRAIGDATFESSPAITVTRSANPLMSMPRLLIAGTNQRTAWTAKVAPGAGTADTKWRAVEFTRDQVTSAPHLSTALDGLVRLAVRDNTLSNHNITSSTNAGSSFGPLQPAHASPTNPLHSAPAVVPEGASFHCYSLNFQLRPCRAKGGKQQLEYIRKSNAAPDELNLGDHYY